MGPVDLRRRSIRFPVVAAISCAVFAIDPASAVRINADGHGQALIYPYYTARSTSAGDAYVTALSVTNTTSSPKAVKVRVLEARAGRELLEFNLYLAARDVWTAGIVANGAGAAIATEDGSCTNPRVGDSRAPTAFSNSAYVGDQVGDGLERTTEGYVELIEMGTIDPGSDFGRAIGAANVGVPPAVVLQRRCLEAPSANKAPVGLTRPSGGLVGKLSIINVGEGTDYTWDAIALSQWSGKVQWSVPPSAWPNLEDANPPVSTVLDNSGDVDVAYVTRWDRGRDAVSALFMADTVMNEYSIEPGIRAATDWIMTLPTKRFHVSRERVEPPFVLPLNGSPSGVYSCQALNVPRETGRNVDLDFNFFDSRDREGQRSTQYCIWLVSEIFECGQVADICGNVSVLRFGEVYPSVFNSTRWERTPLSAVWSSGWTTLTSTVLVQQSGQPPTALSRLVAPRGGTTVIDFRSGVATPGVSVSYVGLPIAGFAAQRYSTDGLPGVDRNVVSIYGGQFNHKFSRRIEVVP